MAPPRSKVGQLLRGKSRRRRALYAALVVLLACLALYALTLPSAPEALHPLPRSYDARVSRVMAASFGMYWKKCRGRDEMRADGSCEDWLKMGITALDSIDTLMYMGLWDEYDQVRTWMKEGGGPLDSLSRGGELNVFETTIRALGGLNAAYGMSNDTLWLQAAVKLGDILLPAFDTPTGCPHSMYSPATRGARAYRAHPSNVTGVADAGTLQLEFRTLSVYTGEKRYAMAVDRCMWALLRALPSGKVAPHEFDVVTGGFYRNGGQTIGAGVDSFVEMLLKVYIAFGKQDAALVQAFLDQVDAVLTNLVRREGGTTILGSKERWNKGLPEATMEHLACFFPAVLALAHHHGIRHARHDMMRYARELTRTCYLMTRSTTSGIATETSYVMEDGKIYPAVSDSFLRPEIIEAVYVMYKVTGDEMYRVWARQMWQDLERTAMRQGVLSSIQNVGYSTERRFDKLNSFVLSETLKYFWGIFRDDGPDLRRVVFNTEAHPVPIVDRPPVPPMLF